MIEHVERLRVDPVVTAALADLLGADDLDISIGAPLPAPWHWAALARWRPWATLGADGHAEDSLMPTTPELPRRMFAGGQVRVLRPLAIGADVTVRRWIENVRDTQGRSGALRFVTVRSSIEDDEGVTFDETQDIVYRPAATPEAQTTPAPVPASTGLDTSTEPWRLQADASMLMRFSALTSNNHRIHYDLTHATQIEGYPGLVVHGPLQTMVLAERIRRTGQPFASLTHRGRSPLFAGQIAQVDLQRTDSSSEASLVRDDTVLSEVTVHHTTEEGTS